MTTWSRCSRFVVVWGGFFWIRGAVLSRFVLDSPVSGVFLPALYARQSRTCSRLILHSHCEEPSEHEQEAVVCAQKVLRNANVRSTSKTKEAPYPSFPHYPPRDESTRSSTIFSLSPPRFQPSSTEKVRQESDKPNKDSLFIRRRNPATMCPTENDDYLRHGLFLPTGPIIHGGNIEFHSIDTAGQPLEGKKEHRSSSSSVAEGDTSRPGTSGSWGRRGRVV